jgi:hypothetical protein
MNARHTKGSEFRGLKMASAAIIAVGLTVIGAASSGATDSGSPTSPAVPTALPTTTVPNAPTSISSPTPTPGAGASGQATFQGSLPSWASSTAAGAQLSVYQWPDLTGALQGDTFQLPLVTTQNVSGPNYSIALPSAPGIHYQFVLETNQNAGVVNVDGASPGGPPLSLSQSRVLTNGVSSLRDLSVPSFKTESLPRIQSHTGPTSINGCAATLYNFEGPYGQLISQVHTSAYASASFTYTNDSSDAVTAGISFSAWNSGYSASGTWTTSGSSGSSIPVPSSQSDYVFGNYNWGVFHLRCGNVRPIYEWANIAYEYVGGLSLASGAPTNPLGYCPVAYAVTLGHGSGQNTNFSVLSSTSHTWNNGLSIFGVGISQALSYGSTRGIAYTANATGVSYLCGINGGDPSGSPIVYNSTVSH